MCLFRNHLSAHPTLLPSRTQSGILLDIKWVLLELKSNELKITLIENHLLENSITRHRPLTLGRGECELQHSDLCRHRAPRLSNASTPASYCHCCQVQRPWSFLLGPISVILRAWKSLGSTGEKGRKYEWWEGPFGASGSLCFVKG